MHEKRFIANLKRKQKTNVKIIGIPDKACELSKVGHVSWNIELRTKW